MNKISEARLTLLFADFVDAAPDCRGPDVIAIPGLEGSSTWNYMPTTESSTIEAVRTSSWLRDWLPNDLPVSSVHTYDYSRLVVCSSSAIVAIADHLLTEIQRLRSKQEKSVPLLFIGHSVGGLVLKLALTRAFQSRTNEALEDILTSTRGIIFFGTPHSGSATDLNSTLCKIGAFKSTGLALGDIEDMHKSMIEFARLASHLVPWKVISFYEEIPLVGKSVVAVNHGQMELWDSPRISLHRNHHDLCRYSSIDDQAYEKVVEAIRNLMHTQILTNITSVELQHEEILESLECENDYIGFSNAHEGTCDWIFDNEDFRSWLWEPSEIFWIYGKPGVGKTTLSKHLIENGRQRFLEVTGNEPDQFASFYFSIHHKQSTLASLAGSLLYQLLTTAPNLLASEILGAFVERRELVGSDHPWDEGFLVENLTRLIQRSTLSGTSICIVIDGLDECHDPVQVVVVLKRLKNASTTPGRLWICVLSRPWPDLRLHTNLQVEMGGSNNTGDIQKFVSDSIFEAAARRPDEEAPCTSSVQSLAQIITKQSAGVFLWAYLLVKNLFYYPERLFTQHIVGVADLDRFYEAILSRLRSSHDELQREVTQRALLLVLYAKRQLTPFELWAALRRDIGGRFERPCKSNPAYEVEAKHSFTFSSTTTSSIAYQIAMSSGALLAVSTQIRRRARGKPSSQTRAPIPIVTFAHQSAQDFMRRQTLASFFSNIEHLSYGKLAFDFEIARLCLHCIDVHWQSRKNAFEHAKTTSAGFLRYSVLHVMAHIGSAARRGLQPDCNKIWKAPQFQHEFVARWIHMYRKLSGNYSLFKPGKTTAAHIMAHFDIPWFHTRIWAEEGSTLHLDEEDHRGLTPLSLAAAQGHLDSCEKLVSCGANVNHRSFVYGQTPLGLSIAHGHKNVTKLLIASGADIEEGEGCQSPLWTAVQGGHSHIVRELLKSGADAAACNPQTGETVLERACAVGHVPIVSSLLSSGANIEHRDKRGWTALHYAISRGRKGTLELLVSAIGPEEYIELSSSYDNLTNSWVATVFRALISELPFRQCHTSESPPSCGSQNFKVPDSRESGTQSGSSGQKRSRKELGSDSDEDECEDKDQSPSDKRSRPSSSSEIRFACPYHKKNPIRYSEGACNGLGFLNIYRLKTHLRNKHWRSSLERCHRCQKRFDHASIRKHTRRKDCQERDQPNDYEDGYDAAQSAKLESNDLVPHKSNNEKCWGAIFMVLFPDWGTIRPLPSPYHTGHNVLRVAPNIDRLYANLMDARTLATILDIQVASELQQLLEQIWNDAGMPNGAPSTLARRQTLHAANYSPYNASERPIPAQSQSQSNALIFNQAPTTPQSSRAQQAFNSQVNQVQNLMGSEFEGNYSSLQPYLPMDGSFLGPSLSDGYTDSIGPPSLDAQDSAIESLPYNGSIEELSFLGSDMSYSNMGFLGSYHGQDTSSNGSFAYNAPPATDAAPRFPNNTRSRNNNNAFGAHSLSNVQYAQQGSSQRTSSRQSRPGERRYQMPGNDGKNGGRSLDEHQSNMGAYRRRYM